MLRADKTAIIKAASKAEQAYRYLKAYSDPVASVRAATDRELEDA